MSFVGARGRDAVVVDHLRQGRAAQRRLEHGRRPVDLDLHTNAIRADRRRRPQLDGRVGNRSDRHALVGLDQVSVTAAVGAMPDHVRPSSGSQRSAHVEKVGSAIVS